MLRLDVNTAGAWKTVVPEFNQVDLDVKPMGEVLWTTAGIGARAEWRCR